MVKPKHDDPAQSRRFVELSKQLEAEGDAESFMQKVRKLAGQQRKGAKPRKAKRKA